MAMTVSVAVSVAVTAAEPEGSVRAIDRDSDRVMTTSGSFTPIYSKSLLNHRGTEATEPHRGFSDQSQDHPKINSCEVMISLCGFSVFSVPL
ncbi:MAG TPA: hypothetical protein VLT81_02485, partial [Chondromyces sp.]|nr:hypothetical protein [Chondromyces sp.]